MISLFHRLVTAGVLAVWGSVLLALYFTGRIGAYLHPTFQPFALVAGCTLVCLAFLVLIAPESGSAHGSAARSSVRLLLTALILVVPLLLAFFHSSGSFGASTVANRTYVQDIAQLPGAPSSAADGSKAPSATAAPEDKFGFPKNQQGQIQAQLMDFLYAAKLPEVREQLENQPVEIIGQLMPAKTNNAKGNRYVVIRMFMTCCAADAQPVAIPIDPLQKPELPDMTWVRVTGTAAFPVEGGQRKPLIQNSVIEKIDPPQAANLY
jgi:uncharacterized repeat protein (TIGR03943 family)